MRSCSYVHQKTSCQGPSRIQPGKKPLYSAKKPSPRTVFTQQSTVPLYTNSPPGPRAWFMIRDLATSAGVLHSAAKKPLQTAEKTWQASESPSHVTKYRFA